MKAGAELFRFGAVAPIDCPKVTSQLPPQLEVHGCSDIDSEHQGCNDRATAKDHFPLRSPRPPGLSLWMGWICFGEPWCEMFQCCKALTVVRRAQDGWRLPDFRNKRFIFVLSVFVASDGLLRRLRADCNLETQAMSGLVVSCSNNDSAYKNHEAKSLKARSVCPPNGKAHLGVKMR